MNRKNKVWYNKKRPGKIYTQYLQYTIKNESDTTELDALLGCNKNDDLYKCLFTETPEKKKERKQKKKNSCKNNITKHDKTKRDRTKHNFSNVNPDTRSRHHKSLPYILNYKEYENKNLPTESFRVLHAPKLKDDFYYNLLDWSSKNMIAVGLGSSLCLWNNNNGKSEQLFLLSPMKNIIDATKKMKNRYVTSVKWNKQGNLLAVGLSNGAVDIWEIIRKVKIRKYKNHKLRVGALSWNGNILTSGGRDASIINYDIRAKENNITQIKKHKLEVCGLQWSLDGQQLASGSNDTSLYIWEQRTNKPLFHFNKHKATVKALAWSPHTTNLLISGGGCTDKNIFFWDTTKGICLNKIHTGSQVCALMWSKNTTEFVSTHNSLHNQIVIWKYPKPKKITVLSEHETRVLHLALSPDGTTFITASPDETIRFWEAFPAHNDTPFLNIWNNPHEYVR